MKHYNIPIFMPEMACPFRCVYCNQYSITGLGDDAATRPVGADSVRQTILSHLSSFPEKERYVEVAFFGGNFTGLPESLQDECLDAVQPFIKSGEVQAIRCSTRPDYIRHDRLKVLKNKGMQTIELGAQSTNDQVLLSCGRGHDFKVIEKASKLILAEGITLGLQMMIGLPDSSPEKDLQTAHDIVLLGAKETRIYPCLVVKDTILAKRYEKKSYHPLTLDDAVQQAADIYTYFITHGVKVLRIGLHPSEELDSGACIAGPYHHNFAEMVYSEVWRRRFETLKGNGEHLTIMVHPSQRTHAIGYQSTNKNTLQQRFQKVDFISKENITINSFNFNIQSNHYHHIIIASSLMPQEAKERLKQYGEVQWLESTDFVYPSIAAHPDIYFFQYSDNQLVFAPDTPKEWIAFLHQKGIKMMRGKTSCYQSSKYASYNACGTADLLIHNLKYTDERIMKLYEGKTMVDVPQSFTRCNLLAINERAFMTSDKGIYRTLAERQYDVLYIDPHQIQLPGHDYGFFPGCCGIADQQLFVCGSTGLLKEKHDFDAFLSRHHYELIELYEGPLTDLGGIFFVRGIKNCHVAS